MYQMTIRSARISAGFKLKEVEQKLKQQGVKVTAKTLGRYERDSGKMPIHVVTALIHLYHVPIGLIYIGKEGNCLLHNQSRRRTVGA